MCAVRLWLGCCGCAFLLALLWLHWLSNREPEWLLGTPAEEAAQLFLRSSFWLEAVELVM